MCVVPPDWEDRVHTLQHHCGMVQSGDLLHRVADTFMSILHILLELDNMLRFLVMIAESF